MSEYITRLRIIDENGQPQDKQIDYNALANLPKSLPANGGHANTADSAYQADHALSADSANYAENANTANSADSANFADFADYAGRASIADQAERASVAEQAHFDINGNAFVDTYATKEDLANEVANLVDSAPEALDTLGELSTAIKQHEDAYDALLEVVGKKAEKSEVSNIINNADTNPIENSKNLVTSGGVYKAIKDASEKAIDAIILKSSNSSQLFKITIDNNGTLRATKI